MLEKAKKQFVSREKDEEKPHGFMNSHLAYLTVGLLIMMTLSKVEVITHLGTALVLITLNTSNGNLLEETN